MKNFKHVSMVNHQIKSVTRDKRIIEAFLKVPRHLFVTDMYKDRAYEDYPLPIGYGQTISQPSLVAKIINDLRLHGNEKALEIGTGSGYQAALLSYLVDKLYSIEIIPELATRAIKILSKLNINNVFVKMGDGTIGLEEEAPFDAIIVAATGKEIPKLLIDQLAEGGKIIIPVLSNGMEILKFGIKKKNKLITKDILPVRFVPLIGEYEPF